MCCQWAAAALPHWLYATLFALCCIAATGAGGYYIYFGITFVGSNAGAFISKEVYIGTLVLGSILILLGVYGLVAINLSLCRGAKDEHLKLHYVCSLLTLLTLLSFTIVCVLNANDVENLDSMLDYGWQKAFSLAAKNALISKTQVDQKCCGYSNQSDRAIGPCPTNADGGCSTALKEELKTQFSLAAVLFGSAAGGVVSTAG